MEPKRLKERSFGECQYVLDNDSGASSSEGEDYYDLPPRRGLGETFWVEGAIYMYTYIHYYVDIQMRIHIHTYIYIHIHNHNYYVIYIYI